MKPIRIYCEPFGETIYVYYGTDAQATIKSIRRLMNNNNIAEFPEGCQGQCKVMTHNTTIIWTRHRDIPGLAHECFHAVYEMLKRRDIRLDQEIIAYQLEWLMRKILRLMIAKQPKIKKVR